MNLLAHLHLGQDLPPLAKAGNLLCDYQARRPAGPAFSQGMTIHRRTDAFVDAHDATRAARRIFDPPLRRYAGVLVDLAFDHCLVHEWDAYETVEKQTFVRGQLDELRANSDQLPEDIATILYRMRAERWLETYETTEGVGGAIRRMAERRPAAAPLIGAEALIAANRASLTQCFHALYPDVIELVRRLGSSIT